VHGANMSDQRPPLPPYTLETAVEKVRRVEDGSSTRPRPVRSQSVRSLGGVDTQRMFGGMSWGRIVKRIAAGMAALALVAGAVGYGWYWWQTDRYMESTNDAYVRADYTIVAPKVSGYIATVLVEDNQPVTAGQILAHIDDRDFNTALAQAQADVANAEAGIRNLDAQLALQQSVIDQANADIASAEAALDFATQDYTRY